MKSQPNYSPFPEYTLWMIPTFMPFFTLIPPPGILGLLLYYTHLHLMKFYWSFGLKWYILLEIFLISFPLTKVMFQALSDFTGPGPFIFWVAMVGAYCSLFKKEAKTTSPFMKQFNQSTTLNPDSN